jgi:hypothetical protein
VILNLPEPLAIPVLPDQHIDLLVYGVSIRAGEATYDLGTLNGSSRYRDLVRLAHATERDAFVQAATIATPLDAEGQAKLASALLTALDEIDVRVRAQRATEAAAQTERTEHVAADEGSEATILVKLTDAWELFHDLAGDAYCTFEDDDGHQQTWKLTAKPVRQRLMQLFYQVWDSVPRSQSVADALGVLAGRALFMGPEKAVFVRVGGQDEAVYLDLCNAGWECVRITATGWAIASQAEIPLKFRRARGMQALPHPTHGGTIAALRPFLNLGEQGRDTPDVRSTWYLIVAWLLGCLAPRGPYPLLALYGEQAARRAR